MIWTFHLNLNEEIDEKAANLFVHCSLLIERREESVLENIDLREYFSFYLLIYSMETYAK